MFRSILVVFEKDEDNTSALDRALQLQAQSKATLHFLWVDYNHALLDACRFEKDRLERAIESYLQHQAAPMEEVAVDWEQHKGIHVETHHAWNKRRYEAIINVAADCGCDVVIKTTSYHKSLKQLFFTPTDWSLLRTCPMPLWLTSHETGKINGSVMAAIDPSNNHKKSPELNDLILGIATYMARLFKQKLDVIHTYSTLSQEILVATGESALDYEKYSDESRQEHQQLMNKATEDISDIQFETHLLEGEPEWVIPQFATSHNGSILIMGTSYRTGLKRALMGSTAESILAKLPCDIVAIKPLGFSSPVLDHP